MLATLLDRIDFVGAAGSLIARETATAGLTIPMHPAAVAFFGETAPSW